jgi:hypothetical protein
LDKYGLMYDSDSISTKVFLKIPLLYSLAYYTNVLTSSFPWRVKINMLRDLLRLEKKMFFAPYRKKKHYFEKLVRMKYL